jgi:hypothetical protein
VRAEEQSLAYLLLAAAMISIATALFKRTL